MRRASFLRLRNPYTTPLIYTTWVSSELIRRRCACPLMTRVPRLSGLQRQVLSLYRTVIRTARIKGPAEAAPILHFARGEFHRYQQVDRKNYQLIEHLMRKAKKQLAMVQHSRVTSVKLF